MIVRSRRPAGDHLLFVFFAATMIMVAAVVVAMAERKGYVLVLAPALNSRLRHWVSDVDGALAHARERLDLAIAALRRAA